MKKILLLILMLMFFISPKIFCQNDDKLRKINDFSFHIEMMPAFLYPCKIDIFSKNQQSYAKICIPNLQRNSKIHNYCDNIRLESNDLDYFFSIIGNISLIEMKSNPKIGLDGVWINVDFENESGKNSFHFWSPRKGTKEHTIIEAVMGLSEKKFTAKKFQGYFELLEQYFDFGLPCKIISSDPNEIKIYGTITSYDSVDLCNFFNKLPMDKPILVDMTNFVDMGTLLYPLFRDFNKRNINIVWAIRNKRQLSEIGIEKSKIVESIELGRKKIKKLINKLNQ